MIPKPFREINRPSFRRGRPVCLPASGFVFVGAGLVPTRLCRGNSRIALPRANAKRRGVLPYAFPLRSTFAAFALILFSTGIAFPSNAPAPQNPDSASVTATDTFDVTEAKVLIIYPKGRLLSARPCRSSEKNRAGSFAAIDFGIEYGNIILSEILFHSLESCSIYTETWKNPPLGPGSGGDESPKSAYSQEEFKRQRKAWQSEDSLSNYDFITIGNRNYLYTCGFDSPSGFYVAGGITFIDDIRITTWILSDDNCSKTHEACTSLLSKIEFIPYQEKNK